MKCNERIHGPQRSNLSVWHIWHNLTGTLLLHFLSTLMLPREMNRFVFNDPTALHLITSKALTTSKSAICPSSLRHVVFVDVKSAAASGGCCKCCCYLVFCYRFTRRKHTPFLLSFSLGSLSSSCWLLNFNVIQERFAESARSPTNTLWPAKLLEQELLTYLAQIHLSRGFPGRGERYLPAFSSTFFSRFSSELAEGLFVIGCSHRGIIRGHGSYSSVIAGPWGNKDAAKLTAVLLTTNKQPGVFIEEIQVFSPVKAWTFLVCMR